ncbi:hypothetical protein JTF08_01625 [Micrococcaceae bacterium RIT802]|nr:hypothetical protein [Micrococcaceae bacterium RIT 802]
MSAPRTGRAAKAGSRRPGRLRVAAIVYAVVVILGLAGTGAHALWSQSGTVAASIVTGTWGPQPVTSVKCSADIDWLPGTDTLTVTFTSPADADQIEVAIAKGSATPTTKSVPVGASRHYSVELSVKSEWLATQSLNLTVTPLYADTAGTPVVRTVTLKKDFWGAASASC